MKTLKLYDKNSYIKEFNANVLSCEEYNENYAVVLSETAFFPEGGGQGSDKGYLDNAEVFDVQITDEKIFHITDKPLPVGVTVTGIIDWHRRFDFMQQHSGEHIISGIAHKLFGCENVGFHLGEDIVTLDFDKPLEKTEIEKLEKLSNEAVFKNLNFYTYYPDSETLKNLTYRSKKELDGDIRIVEIEDTDMCACCAPHVKCSGEIGIIKFISTERLRGGVRIEIKCGTRALNDYCEKFDNTLKISNKLCVKQNETADAVDRLLGQIAELKFELTGYKKHIIASKVENFENSAEITASFEENFDMKELQNFADSLFKTYGGIRAVLSDRQDGFSFVISGEDKALQDFFACFKAEFSVKGGGRNGMVQGTVLAKREEIENFFGELK